MNSKEKLTGWIVSMIAVVIMTIIGALLIDAFGIYSVRKTFIKNGYEQVTVIGFQNPVWQKVRADICHKENK